MTESNAALLTRRSRSSHVLLYESIGLWLAAAVPQTCVSSSQDITPRICMMSSREGEMEWGGQSGKLVVAFAF